MESNFKDSGHPVFRASSALDRGYLRKKGGTYSIHFNRDTSNAELLCRTIYSANQLSIYGAVADWCDALAQHLTGQSFSSIEKINCESEWTVESHIGVRGSEDLDNNTWDRCSVIETSIAWSPREIRKSVEWKKVTQTCEKAGLMRKVSPKIHDIDDGFGGKTAACREYTLPRDHDDSEPVGWIRQQRKSSQPSRSEPRVILTNMELKFRYHIEKLISLLGCDFQRPKPLRGWSLWRNRRASTWRRDGVLYKHRGIDPDKATGTVDPTDESSFQDIHPGWPTEVEGHAVSCVKRKSLAWRVSKKATRLSRHQNLLRDFDGAIDWCFLLPMLRREFEIEGAGVFSDFQWRNLIHRGSDKPKFQYSLVWIQTRISCTSEPFKVTQEELWLISLYWIMLKFQLDGKSTCTMSKVH